MTEVIAHRGFHGPSNEEAIEAIHNELDALWDDASFVPDMDRMTFATAVIEAAANIVQHAFLWRRSPWRSTWTSASVPPG